MRIRPLLTAAALAAGLLAAPGIATAAAADTAMAAGHAHAAAAACTYRRVGNTWKCVTPGAYCPKAAHLKIGYDKYNGRRYRCSKYPNGQWRWKRA